MVPFHCSGGLARPVHGGASSLPLFGGKIKRMCVSIQEVAGATSPGVFLNRARLSFSQRLRRRPGRRFRGVRIGLGVGVRFLLG